MKFKFIQGKTQWSNFSLESLKAMLEEISEEINGRTAAREEDERMRADTALYKKMKRILRTTKDKDISCIYDVYHRLIPTEEKFRKVIIDLEREYKYPCYNDDCWCHMNPDRAGGHPDVFYEVIFSPGEIYCEMCCPDGTYPDIDFVWTDSIGEELDERSRKNKQ